MNSIENKIVIYDGTCELCSRGAKLTLEYTKFPTKNISTYDDLPVELQSKVDYLSFRNEMAVIDTGNHETLYGLEGILYVMSCRYKILAKIKKGTFLFNVLNVLYRLVAFNRYILFPHNSLIKCSCQPPFNKRYRILLITFCILFSILFTALFGMTISMHFEKSIIPIVNYTLIAIGSGWALQIITAVLLLRGEKLYDYLGNLGVIMIAGELILLPGILTTFLHSMTFFCITGACVIISFLIMTRMHIKRTRILELNIMWTISWVLFLQLSVLLSIYILTK